MTTYTSRNDKNSLLKKFIRFLGISGIGWLLDFFIYCFLIFVLNMPVFWANIFSAIPAVTLVFFVSICKVFKKKESNMPLWFKYIIYICYTIVLLLLVSALGQCIYGVIIRYDLFIIFNLFLPIMIKCGITGITIMCNFFMMKFLTEAI